MASAGDHSGDVDLNVPTVPDIREQPASAPISPDHEEEARADGHSSTGIHEDLSRSNGRAGPSRPMDGENSGSETNSTGESTGTDSDDDSETDSESHTRENKEELQSAPRAAGEEFGEGSQQANQDAAMTRSGKGTQLMGKIRNDLQKAKDSIATLRTDLKTLEKLHDDAIGERDTGNGKVADLEDQIRTLQVKEKGLISEVGRLTTRVAELEESLKSAQANSSSSDPSGRIVELEKLLRHQEAETQKAKEGAKKAAQLAVQMQEHGFKLAMSQVKVVNPSMGTFEDKVIQLGHSVEEGKIVKIDKATKKKTLIYPPSV